MKTEERHRLDRALVALMHEDGGDLEAARMLLKAVEVVRAWPVDDDSAEPEEEWAEWRVTGQPDDFPPYEFVWSPHQCPPESLRDPEHAARYFIQRILGPDHQRWLDGPHLSKRTVRRTAWQAVPIDDVST